MSRPAKSWRSSAQVVSFGGFVRTLLALAVTLALGKQPELCRGAESDSPDTVSTSDARQLAAQYVEKFIERTRLQSHDGATAKQLKQPQDTGRPAWLADLSQTDPEMQRALAGMLQSGVQPVVRDVTAATASLRAQRESWQQTWRDIRASLFDDRKLLFDIQASQQTAGQAAWLLSVDKKWYWLSGLVAVAVLGGVVVHERRRELRRVFSGGRARTLGLSKLLALAVVVLAGITVVTFVLGDRIFDALVAAGSPDSVSPRAEIEAQIAALDAEVAKLRQSDRDGPANPAEAAEKHVAAAAPSHPALDKPSQQFHRAALELQEELAILEKLPAAIEADQNEQRQVAEQLDSLAGQRVRYLRLREGIRVGVGCSLLGLVAIGAVLFRRGVRKRREEMANTCPLCLGRGRLETAPETAGANGDLAVLRCKNVISQRPYEECDYSFMSVYRHVPKLCFPTLGVPQAGKTHWLAMLYWELNRGNYPRAVQFEKVRSRSSEDFDVMVEEILRSRLGTAATQRDRIPHPLVFSFRDHDRWGRSNVLVNIFDYSGEVTADMGLDDFRRRRALTGDGFLFFLDPTFPSEPQAKALADFREDLRLVRGMSAGKPISVPVALCISKIDILAGQGLSSPDGSDPIARFYDELSKIDPTGESVSLRAIEARSQLTARLRHTIWPGWQVERQVHDLFGGRYKFFPLTPVGLDGVGETDLSLRTISPFGLLEPLVWLLEMNGYPVLE